MPFGMWIISLESSLGVTHQGKGTTISSSWSVLSCVASTQSSSSQCTGKGLWDSFVAQEKNKFKAPVEVSPVLRNKNIPGLWQFPRLAASSHYLIMICCIHQLAGDEPPPLFSQSGVAVSALQLFRAHISTRLSIPEQAEVLEMQPWREKLQWGRPNFTLNGAKLSQAHFLLLKCVWLQFFVRCFP